MSIKSGKGAASRGRGRRDRGGVPADIGSRAGSRLHLVLLGCIAVLGGLGVFLFLRQNPERPFTDAERPNSPWNVVLVSLDTTRPDLMAATAEAGPLAIGDLGNGGAPSASPDGGGRPAPVATPSLNRVRGDGFLFTSMVSPAPVTLPSHASLFTGLNPNRHGVRENTEYALPGSANTLAEHLRDAGYLTQAFVSAFVLDQRFGLAQGFHDYSDEMSGPEQGLRFGSVELPAAVTATRIGQWIGDYAEGLRDGREERPFFLFAHFFDAHAPYAAPAPYRSQFASDPYAGELAYQDACLGLVLDRLEAEGLAERTLIWVVSDHGESLGAHGEDTHSLFVYEATQRVVSLLRLPSPSGFYEAGDTRRQIEDVASLVDVPSTLADLLGLPIPFETDGKSLVPQMRGEPDPDRVVYVETWSPYVSYGWAPLEGVRSLQWKYVRAPIPELYDLVSDPFEENNLAAARPDAIQQWEQALSQFTSGGNVQAEREANEEELERLRSLGYLGGGPRPDIDHRDLPDPKRQIRFFRESFQRAKSLLHAGKTAEAIRAFESAREIDPANPAIHVFLASAYRRDQQPGKAAASYMDAIALQPRTPRAWNGLGRAFLQSGKTDSAAVAFEEARELLPSSPDAWEGLADVATTRGDFVGAAALLDSARVRGGIPLLIHGKLARIYREHLPDPDKAGRHLDAFAKAIGVPKEAAIARLPLLESGIASNP